LGLSAEQAGIRARFLFWPMASLLKSPTASLGEINHGSMQV
jgi:hypothetical protein